jgi:ferredoxin-NADP reductase
VHSDPFEAEGVVAAVDDMKSSTRRRTELKRPALNGWQRADATQTVLGKSRNLYTCTPDQMASFVETSLEACNEADSPQSHRRFSIQPADMKQLEEQEVTEL